ncbi:hypothetical protein SASPL_115534 [Salvia splendens]|uniref:Terpene synthase N-terminal domain-containing protein n=1 Tax=Salvia splendens TaxID=180675 RepID=A0A8X8Y3X7_SALSN|nr:hypothetical protein SASPL_115534 [Salvia splendens]
MANLSMHISLPIPHKPPHHSYTTFHGGATTRPRRSSTRCNAMPSAQTTTVPVPARRYANYKPSFWDFNYIQSLTTQYTERDLYSTALEFRLLREHGFRVSQDVFDCFKNEKGDFKTSLCDDRRGMLQLYEASFLLTHGEETLELANEFATKYLQKIVDEGDDDHNLLEMNEMERGDVAESIQCYMKESGASVEEAREHARFLIWKSWKRMNEERVTDSHFSKEFIKKAVDLGRMAQYMYQLGDGHGIQNPLIKDRISSLFFKPIV